jgi:hypothetical protein
VMATAVTYAKGAHTYDNTFNGLKFRLTITWFLLT